MEINFYQFDETLTKSVAPLILKILEEKKKALIFSRDSLRIKEVDDGLWSYGKNKFIPHITIFDQDFILERQPILISDREENSNQADYLILTEKVSEEFAKKFSRIFYFFNALGVEEAKKTAASYKKIASKFNSYKKEDAKWVKADIK